MDASALPALVAKLLIAAELLSGYPPPAEPPAVTAVARSELVARACAGPCGIRALFPPGRVIYVDADLLHEIDTFARSILLHEIVHYLQQEAGAFATLAPCERWLARERQALLVQRRWLAAQGVSPQSVRSPLLGPLRIDCRVLEAVPRH